MEPNAQTTSLPLYELDAASCPAQHSGALTALRLLRSYDRFLVPSALYSPHNSFPSREERFLFRSSTGREVQSMVGPLLAALPPQPHYVPPYCHHLPIRTTTLLTPPPLDTDIRRRGEKRPIPPELKDEKYFERRRRNNQAAKKSRDARRIREDQIAWRACLLEQENASLRAHVAALRQEALALRGLLAARDEPPAPSSTTPD